jgi:hypothetical protein
MHVLVEELFSRQAVRAVGVQDLSNMGQMDPWKFRLPCCLSNDFVDPAVGTEAKGIEIASPDIAVASVLIVARKLVATPEPELQFRIGIIDFGGLQVKGDSLGALVLCLGFYALLVDRLPTLLLLGRQVRPMQ